MEKLLATGVAIAIGATGCASVKGESVAPEKEKTRSWSQTADGYTNVVEVLGVACGENDFECSIPNYPEGPSKHVLNDWPYPTAEADYSNGFDKTRIEARAFKGEDPGPIYKSWTILDEDNTLIEGDGFLLNIEENVTEGTASTIAERVGGKIVKHRSAIRELKTDVSDKGSETRS